MNEQFTHLHVHSNFSILDSPIMIKELTTHAAEMGFLSIALTDHGSMSGSVRFQYDATEAGIKPIFGNEVYVTKTDLSAEEKMKPEDKRKNYSHLVLLAKNNVGLMSITRLTSLGAMNGFYYRPRVDYQMLAENSEGIICLTACLSGTVASAILDDDYALAFKRLKALKQIYGENLYYELQFNEMTIQAKVNQIGIEMARQLDISLVYTSDIHYLLPGDNAVQDMMVLIKRGKTIDDIETETFDVRGLYMKSVKQICEDYLRWGQGVNKSAFKEAMQNTNKIAANCNASFIFDTSQYPVYNAGNEGIEKCFLRKTKEGFDKLDISKRDRKEYLERIRREVKLIVEKDIASYFLIIADLMKFANDNKIPVGPGRGSVGGSLVAFALGITKVDPIKFKLSFERFLSKEREGLPDIDLDFCDWGRALVVEYLKGEYGDDKVLPIISFSTFHVKGLIRDLGRVLKVPAQDLSIMSKAADEVDLTGSVAMPSVVASKVFSKQVEKYPELFEYAVGLEGRVRHMTRHAAGVVVAPETAVDFVPIIRSGNILHCGFDYEAKYLSLDKLKVLKIDVLGLATLSVIGDTLNLIESGDEDFDEEYCWRLDDPEVYKAMRQGNTIGIFQMESAGFRRLLKNISPSIFEHVIAAVALYRPSTLTANIHSQYVKNKRRNFRHRNSVVGGILNVTYGCLIFQEQVMALAAKLGKLTLGDADLIRRALTKWHSSSKLSDWKGKEVIVQFRERFIEGAIENDMQKAEAEAFYDQMEKFSLYSFNRSHSCAYALISWQTIYLKSYHSLEYMTSLLRRTPPGVAYKGQVKLNSYVIEAKRLGLSVLPPDIEKSSVNFDLIREGNSIIVGLSTIKWVGDKPAQNIIDARPFSDFDDFLEKVGKINSRAIRSLLAAGCFDDDKFGSSDEIFDKLKKFKNLDINENDITYNEAMHGISL